MRIDDKKVNEVKQQILADLSGRELNGYFAKRVRAGERPNYVYPPNHLPTATGGRMKIVTSYLAAGASRNR